MQATAVMGNCVNRGRSSIWEMLHRSSRTNGGEEDEPRGDGGCETHRAFSPPN